MSEGRPLSLKLYGLAARAASPFAPALLRRRARRGKEDAARVGERLGRASLPRPAGRLAWLHGVSVGESLSLLPLAERLRCERPGLTVLMTSGTRAAAEMLAARMSVGVIHQYAPVDTPAAVAAFLGHWRPDLGVFVESELWPELVLGAKARGVKLALISARISERSLGGWRLAPRAARALLGAYDLLLAQDEAAARRFGALGVTVDGRADLKFGAPPLPANAVELQRLETTLAGRPILLAASTHPGEEAMVLEAFRAVRSSGALLVIAPRHPDRSGEVDALAHGAGLTTTKSGGSTTADVLVVDRLGELGFWFRLATVAFIGGSLVAGHGGHNPLEPARLRCPVVSGPHTANWSVFDALVACGGAVRVGGAADLARVFVRAISGDEALRGAAEIARAYVDARDQEAASVGDRVLALLPP